MHLYFQTARKMHFHTASVAQPERQQKIHRKPVRPYRVSTSTCHKTTKKEPGSRIQQKRHKLSSDRFDPDNPDWQLDQRGGETEKETKKKNKTKAHKSII